MRTRTTAARTQITAPALALLLIPLSGCDELRQRVDVSSAIPGSSAEPSGDAPAPKPAFSATEPRVAEAARTPAATAVAAAPATSAKGLVAAKSGQASAVSGAAADEQAQAPLLSPKAIECEDDADCGPGKACVKPAAAAADWARECVPATTANAAGTSRSKSFEGPALAPSCDLGKVDWKNHFYPVDAVKLEQGQWQDPNAPEGNPEWGLHISFDRVLVGNVTGDAKPEAVVILSKSAKAYYGVAFHVFAVDGQCRVQHLDQMSMDYVGLREASLRGRELVLAYDQDVALVNERFRMVAGKLKSVEKKSTPVPGLALPAPPGAASAAAQPVPQSEAAKPAATPDPTRQSSEKPKEKQSKKRKKREE